MPRESPDQLELLRHDTCFGRQKENLIYPIALANLVLRGIDQPNIWHGNTLTGGVAYDGLYTNSADLFDVVMTNPPFGGKEVKEAQTRFAFKTGATQVLFLQHAIDSLKPTGSCGMVLDKGYCSARTKPPSCKQNANCWTNATCTASSACPAVCSARPARA